LDSKRIADRFSASLNLGAQIRSTKALAAGNGLANQFLYGAGLNYAVAKPVQLIGDVSGWTTFKNFFKENNRNLEINGGVRFLPTESRRLAVTVGGGAGIMNGIGAPDFRVFASVAYRHPAEEKAPKVKEEVIRTNKIHFQYDKATIMPSSDPILDGIVSTIKSRPEIDHVTIEGHTDGKGSEEYNQRLSDRRAASVLDYLVSHGVPRNMLSSVGKGKSEPIAPNEINGKDNPAGRAENRRVEFHLAIHPGSKLRIMKEEQTAPTYEEGSSPSEAKHVRSKRK
jgi:outer membrane protein OmpA-like peptidoglycan-associated protein